MELTTFYLKYRPQKLAELDLKEISQGLLRIGKSGKFPHALLFAGPKGTGKTSAARIFAKVVNCQNLKEGEPCNKCDSCREITKGMAMDLIEIDAASNRGIDDVRELKEKIKLSPAKLKYKVYIIDEVHMLTMEAFNALLKTLEEPPPHAIFILCTTAPEKLPETILSRCMRFNFRKAKPQEIVEGPLKRAIEGEKIEVEKGVLEAIAQGVDGSFRDAHKILEQLAMEGEGKITLQRTKELLGQIEELSPAKLLALLVAKDVKGGLKEIDRIVQLGGDLEVYISRLLEKLRMGLLGKVGVEQNLIPPELKDLNIEEINDLIRLINQAAGEMRYSPIPQLPLELAVVEWVEGKKQNKKQNNKLQVEIKENRPSTSKSNSLNNQSFSSENFSPPHPLFKDIEEKWNEILAKIKPQNHSVEALLKSSRPKNFDGECLILEVFYKFHKERLETEKCRVIVEKTVSQVMGRPVRLKCILGEKPPKKPPSSPSSLSSQEEEVDILELANNIFNGKII